MIKRWFEDTSDGYSRYRRLRRLEHEDGTTRVETPEKVVMLESTGDSFFTVTPDVENRLDLISYRFYGTPLYWWAIAYASEIKDPFKVPVGTVLRIPEPSTLYSIEGVLGNA